MNPQQIEKELELANKRVAAHHKNARMEYAAIKPQGNKEWAFKMAVRMVKLKQMTAKEAVRTMYEL